MKASKRGVSVAEIVVADLIEIVPAHIRRKLGGPVVGVALVDDAGAGIDFFDHVRPAADRGLQCRFLKIPARQDMLWKDRHQPENEGHLPVEFGPENELHRPLVRALDFRDLRIVCPMIGAAMLPQRLQRENHVVDRDRFAVGERRLGPKFERDPAPIVGRFDGFSDEAVERERFIERSRHQAFINMGANACRRHAFDDQRVGVVERTDDRQDQRAAFGRARLGGN